MKERLFYENQFFTISTDAEHLESEEKIPDILNDNLKRIMDFFGLKELSLKIKVVIHSDLEEWKKYFESLGGHYEDYVVGCAWNGVIDALDFSQYEKTECHKNDSYEDFSKVIIHEFVHICNQQLQPDLSKTVFFMGEGLATYLAGQRYNLEEEIYFPKEVYFSEKFFQLHSPYCAAQKIIREFVKKLPREKIVEYACDVEKLYMDWDKIWNKPVLIQLPEEKKNLVIDLFKKKQPNNSALWCYFEGTMAGKTYVDDINVPTKAICKLDMSWTYISDDADFKWIEETLREIIKSNWIQVVWSPSRRGEYPLKDLGKVIPRYEYIERHVPLKQPVNVEISPFTSELFDKLPKDYKQWHLQNYGTKEAFLKKAFGFYAIENEEICCEAEAAFTANGYTEIGIYTFEPYRRKGYAFAACVHTLQELDKKGLKAIWACDKENVESVGLAQKLGFVNPVEYDFIFFPQS